MNAQQQGKIYEQVPTVSCSPILSILVPIVRRIRRSSLQALRRSMLFVLLPACALHASLSLGSVARHGHGQRLVHRTRRHRRIACRVSSWRRVAIQFEGLCRSWIRWPTIRAARTDYPLSPTLITTMPRQTKSKLPTYSTGTCQLTASLTSRVTLVRRNQAAIFENMHIKLPMHTKIPGQIQDICQDPLDQELIDMLHIESFNLRAWASYLALHQFVNPSFCTHTAVPARK